MALRGPARSRGTGRAGGRHGGRHAHRGDRDDTILLSARVGYELSEVWTISAEVFNLLDRDDREIDYFYASRLEGEPAGPDAGGFDDVHFHPVDPISFRAMLTARF